jgi:MFS family permease
MDDYQVTRAAIEVQRIEKSPEDIELGAIERQQRRFFWLSIATMVVSFIHMVGALALFSDGTTLGAVAAFLMTGLVDGATWVVTGYYDYAKRRNLKRGKLVAALLVVALIISCGLNLAYLISHMPATLPGLVGWSVAVAFAVFIPLCIAVASAERGQLEDDKTLYLTGDTRNVAPKVIVTQVAPSATNAPQLLDIDLDMRLPRAQPTSAGIDERAVEWLRLKENGATYAEVAQHFGVARQYVSRHANAYKAQRDATE